MDFVESAIQHRVQSLDIEAALFLEETKRGAKVPSSRGAEQHPLGPTASASISIGRTAHETSAPSFSASGSECCYSFGLIAHRMGTNLSDAARAVDRGLCS